MSSSTGSSTSSRQGAPSTRIPSNQKSQNQRGQPLRHQVNQHSQGRGSRIPIIDISSRFREEYDGDPRDMEYPEFMRKHSFYTSPGVVEPEYRNLQASDVRRQVREPPLQTPFKKYPSKYHNQSPLPLRAQAPRMEYPLTPSPQNGSTPTNYTSGAPGPVRAFYNDHDRNEFDVVYHDRRRPTLGLANSRAHPNTQYSLASYHPAPTYTEVRTLKGSKTSHS